VGLVAPSPLIGPTPYEKAMSQVNGSDPVRAFDDGEAEGDGEAEAEAEGEGEALFTTDTSHHLNSAASMATEILSASPEIPTVGFPEGLESEIISKDVTLIARGRKKKFRFH
jgi:hypothetical protein